MELWCVCQPDSEYPDAIGAPICAMLVQDYSEFYLRRQELAPAFLSTLPDHYKIQAINPTVKETQGDIIWEFALEGETIQAAWLTFFIVEIPFVKYRELHHVNG